MVTQLSELLKYVKKREHSNKIEGMTLRAVEHMVINPPNIVTKRINPPLF